MDRVDTSQVRQDSGQGGHQSGEAGQWTGWAVDFVIVGSMDRVGC